MDKNSVEQQYQNYLKKVHIKEEQMPSTQRTVMRDCFFGSWGMCLMNIIDEVGEEEDEDKAIDMMKKQLDEVNDYFQERAK